VIDEMSDELRDVFELLDEMVDELRDVFELLDEILGEIDVEPNLYLFSSILFEIVTFGVSRISELLKLNVSINTFKLSR
jgi:hypothetical protein